MAATSFNSLWTSIADAGRDLVRGRLSGRRRDGIALCRDLLSTRGEASGAAIAREILVILHSISAEERVQFMTGLAHEFTVDQARIAAAAADYARTSDLKQLITLRRATEAPRLDLFQRMNMAPGGTRALINLRADLLAHLGSHPELAEVDADLQGLISSWFNPGFLSLARIDWNSPAALLEKFIAYEKVHRMKALEDMKRRLAADRRCFAFFHPALPDEPLIFVQVALVSGMADRINALIDPMSPVGDPATADTAIFYSISNCQEGLRGITLGAFLIKAVVAELAAELPEIDVYATLSPLPGFSSWLGEALSASDGVIQHGDRATLAHLGDPGWPNDARKTQALKPVLLRLGAHYLVRAKRGSRPHDPVARFHLGNGARLERLDWLGDPSPKGLRESHGLLVNYRYNPDTIEKNHELYAGNGEVVHASAIRSLLPTATARKD